MLLKFDLSDMSRGTARQKPGEKGVGHVQEAGVEGVRSRIPKVAGSRRKRGKLCCIAQLKMRKEADRKSVV